MANKGNSPETEANESDLKDQPESPRASFKSTKDTPAKYPVSELLNLTSQLIPDIEKPFAVGAMRHAGVKNDDMMTTDQFKEKVEAFKNVRAF